jgi:hypothetical protein
MTVLPIQLPFKGFTEQSQFSAVPQGMTPACLNVMPLDVWSGRTRIGTRNGTKRFDSTAGAIQFMSSYRIYDNGQFVEKLIFVRGGVIYYSDPRDASTIDEFGDGTTQAVPLLNTTGLVEGVQFNDHFFFVDGDHYVLVHLHAPTDANAVHQWGDDSPKAGPYHTDPGTITTGCRATLICRWGARLVLSGYRDTPNLWYACAPDDPYINALAGHGSATDDGWDANEYIGAVAGTSSAAGEYGTLSDPIVAIFPFAQSGLMFACTNSFAFLTGDPLFTTADVQLVSLTRSIGIAGRRAWCQAQEKGAFVLAADGLYFINANDFNFNRANRVSAGRLDSFFLRLDFGTPAIAGSSILSGGTLEDIGSASGATSKTFTDDGGLSEEIAPKTLEFDAPTVSLVGGLDDGDVFPCLCYDPDREGVWVFLTVSGTEQSSLHLYYDLKTDSFWPQRFSDPKMYGPQSAIYIGNSRTKSGRLMMAGSESISYLDRSYPIGIDGYEDEISDADQISRFVRSSLALGPIIAPLPYRLMLTEMRVDMAEDRYETPSGFNDLSNDPVVTISTGDTAQLAVGLQTDSVFVTNQNPLSIDGGDASTASFANIYDGDDSAAIHTDRIDGRFAYRPFGLFSQADPFAEGTSRIYQGPGPWLLRYDALASVGPAWTIERLTTAPSTYTIEYEQIVPNAFVPNGAYSTVQQDPISPETIDNAVVSGAAFSDAEVTEIGVLNVGRNEAFKTRIRSEAMFATIASDGRPWAVERISAMLSQVGKSRGGVA